jgi:hypothetical protein
MQRAAFFGLIGVLVGSTPAPPNGAPHVVRLFVRSQWDSGLFRASGTWKEQGQTVSQGEGHAVDFNCYRNLKVCIEATAMLSGGTLGARTELYDIEIWDASQIRTARSPEPCGYFMVTIDRNPPKLYANKVNDQTRDIVCTTPGIVETIELDAVAPGSVH